LDEKSLEMLEFPKVREIIAGYTSFPASRELALALKPVSNAAKVSLWLKQCAEARHLQTVEPDLQVGEVDDVREPVGLAARGKVLEPQTLAVIARTLTTIRLLKSKLTAFSSEYPLLWDIAQNITDLRTLEKDINTCITPAGELQDTASSELQALRHQIQSRRQQLLTNLEDIIRSPHGQKIIQEPIVTQREGRYVIPVKIESKKELQGIIHDVSNTGATVFIEPWEAIEQGNELRELINEEKREIERIMRRLSADVGVRELEIAGNIALVSEIDLIFAKAKYARRARANEAMITGFEDGVMPPTLRLKDARHPFLGDRAVPLSAEIGRDFSVMVITGPNTGGKTVALKTIGLLSLMTLAGLPIPAHEESRIPVFDAIFVDIGDEQSIEQTLSTFSWHITNISRIIQRSTRQSLVLLDELGTSTDPAEGSALARAILLHFLSKSTMTIATTHLGELKAFAYMTDGLQNASLDFDPVTFAPTYRLTIGLPGGSNALETAARLGLDPVIITDARGMLSTGTLEVEMLITSLNGERDKAQSLRQELETTQASAEELKKELEKGLRELKVREKTIIQEARDRVVSEAAELQREIKQASSELRKQKSQDSVERTRKALANVHERLKGEIWQTQTSPEEKGTPEDNVSPGDMVWLKDANLEAKVVQINKASNEIEVQAGQTRIKLSLEGIERIVPAGAGEARKFVPIIKPQPKQVAIELLLLGRRAEEVEHLLNSYLDDAALANLRQVRVVHGSGTGVLRQIVRDLLSSHPLVKSFRPGERGEGGNGVTVVKL
jgi:DNA mismatch repair protein MutS2